MIATLLLHPVPWSSQVVLFLLLPLSLSLAVIYKTIRGKDLRRLPQEILLTTILMLAGMAALAAALWLFQLYVV